MTLQEFISVWHAQPFRAFRIRARGEIINVQYPLSVALTPQMELAAVVDNTRVEIIGFHEIEQCDVFGLPTPIADLLDAISPDDLSRNAQLISEALSRSDTLIEEPSPAAFSTLRASLQKVRTPQGIFLVQAVLELPNGHAVLSTVGTRWNVHGIEHFENGASLYLHHLDHPIVEQRIIFGLPSTCLVLSLILDMSMVRELLSREELHVAEAPSDSPAMSLGKTTPEFLNACCRLLDLLESPHDIPFLSGLIQREIIYRVLRGPKERACAQ